MSQVSMSRVRVAGGRFHRLGRWLCVCTGVFINLEIIADLRYLFDSTAVFRVRRQGVKTMPQQGKKTKIGRDAGNGQFIPVKEAERRKKTAVVETIKKPKR